MSDFDDIKHLIGLSSDAHVPCQECDQLRSGDDFSVATLVMAANHYVNEHGYRILHIGEETATDHRGRHQHNTVIVLGTNDASNVVRIAAERDAHRSNVDVGIWPRAWSPQQDS